MRVKPALGMLLESYHYAQDVGCDLWEFAVEYEHLRDHGLTASDWRWLHWKGLIDHARELTVSGEAKRTFRHGGALKLSKRTCFVLTEAGVEFAQEVAVRGPMLSASPATELPAPVSPAPVSPALPPDSPQVDLLNTVPTWDRDRQQLRVGRSVVKEFKVPAPNQETILAAFQEENWPPRIDDPLPPAPDIEPKRRLHDTINSLNRNQKEPLLRFFGDGSGQGARWEFARPAEGNGRH
ncbi:MAG TPA: hypothetical protein PK867_10820 [Pirellulales bacterium]|nr:hypothetical protein [Pirellulales bacterium]